MLDAQVEDTLSNLMPGAELGVSPWLTVSQAMIDAFGQATLDHDPMHVDPSWAAANSPYNGTIAFGFLTISLLTHLMHGSMGVQGALDPRRSGYYLNYGFDRVRLVAPVRTGRRVRGCFKLLERKTDEQGRLITTFDCRVEIEGEPRPALVAQWLTVWVPPST
jgi:acyl dehydratase